HPRRNEGRPAVAVDGLREVADPLRQPAVVAERWPPLEPGRHHRVDRCPARPGEPARPAVDVAGTVEHGQRLAGHGPVVDEAVRQLEAGRRHPLERLVQGWRRVTHVVLLVAAAHEPPAAPVPAVDSPLDRILPAESVPRQAAWEGCTRQHISTSCWAPSAWRARRRPSSPWQTFRRAGLPRLLSAASLEWAGEAAFW